MLDGGRGALLLLQEVKLSQRALQLQTAVRHCDMQTAVQTLYQLHLYPPGPVLLYARNVSHNDRNTLQDSRPDSAISLLSGLKVQTVYFAVQFEMFAKIFMRNKLILISPINYKTIEEPYFESRPYVSTLDKLVKSVA